MKEILIDLSIHMNSEKIQNDEFEFAMALSNRNIMSRYFLYIVIIADISQQGLILKICILNFISIPGYTPKNNQEYFTCSKSQQIFLNLCDVFYYQQ